MIHIMDRNTVAEYFAVAGIASQIVFGVITIAAGDVVGGIFLLGSGISGCLVNSIQVPNDLDEHLD